MSPLAPALLAALAMLAPVPAAMPVPDPAARMAPSPPRTPHSAQRAASRATVPLRGIASTYGPGWDGWTALPQGPGHTVRVCGAGGCATVTGNDTGPDRAMRRAGRVADLDVRTFEAVCGAPWTVGLCRVTVEELP